MKNENTAENRKQKTEINRFGALARVILFLLSTFPISAFCGTNAAVTFNTNTFIVSPTNLWQTNATAIQSALLAIGFSGGGGGVTNYFTSQFATNLSGQVQLYNVAASLIDGTIANSNLPATIATLESNLNTGLTNAAGQTIEARVAAATNTIAASSLTGTISSANLPAAILSNATAFIASTNGIENGTLTTTNAPWQHLETNWGWIDTSNGVTMAYESNGVFYSVGIPVSQLTGTIANARLPSDVVTNNGVNTFSAAQTVDNALNVSNISINSQLGASGPPPGTAALNFESGSFVSESEFGPSRLTVQGSSGLTLSGNGQGVSISDFLNLGGTVITSLAVSGNAVITNNLTNDGVFYPNLIQSATYTGTNNWTGDIACPAASVTTLANGENGDIPIGTNSFIIFTGPTAAFSVDGFVASRDGREFTAVFPGGGPVTIRNESGLDATAANRIITSYGADMTLSNNPVVIKFHYQGSSNAWIIQNFNSILPAVLPAGVLTNNFAGTITATAFSGNGSGLANFLHSSTNFPITGGTFTHGLGAVPSYVRLVLVCGTNDSGSGLTVGEEINAEAVYDSGNAVIEFGAVANSTSIIISGSSQTGELSDLQGTSSQFTSMANFALKVYYAK